MSDSLESVQNLETFNDENLYSNWNLALMVLIALILFPRRTLRLGRFLSEKVRVLCNLANIWSWPYHAFWPPRSQRTPRGLGRFKFAPPCSLKKWASKRESGLSVDWFSVLLLLASFRFLIAALRWWRERPLKTGERERDKAGPVHTLISPNDEICPQQLKSQTDGVDCTDVHPLLCGLSVGSDPRVFD